MNKKILLILCIVVFLMAVLGGGAWLLLSPRGTWNDASPDNAMAEYLAEHNDDFFRAQYVELASPEVTEYESRETVAAAMFDTTAGEYTFREMDGVSTWSEIVYLIARGDTDLFTAKVDWDGSKWQVSELGCADLLRGETRTVTVTVPEGTAIFCNGAAVPDTCITESNVPYEEMTELERSLPDHPDRVRYSIPGIYLACEITAEREGGTLLLSSDGTEYDFTVAAPGAHTLCVMAPDAAEVFVDGIALDRSEASASVPYATRMNTTEEQDMLLPGYLVYSFGGLYGDYEVTASLNGEPLFGEHLNGALTFAIPGNETLREELHERVEAFLMQNCRYGAGGYSPADYCVPGSEAAEFYHLAINSVYWVAGTSVTFDSVEAYDFVPAGEDAFLCKGHVLCTSTTNFNSWDLDMSYEMLWVRSGNTWLVQDIAYI